MHCAALFGLVGCTLAAGPEAIRDRADGIAAAAGFVRTYIPAGRFDLIAYRRDGNGPGQTLVVYIEGDGRAWRSRRRVSADPSPADPFALELAVRDPAPRVVYLARPCQFTTAATGRGCAPTYWAHRRFSPEVIDAMGDAIDREKRHAGARRVHLVGYSGGGVVAALLAARRTDIASLVTVAAPLDLAAWTAHHDLTRLDGSLDPAIEAAGIEAVPQIHLAGAEDKVVPPRVVGRFARRRLSGMPGSVEIVEGYTHRCCWRRDWRERIAALRAAFVRR